MPQFSIELSCFSDSSRSSLQIPVDSCRLNRRGAIAISLNDNADCWSNGSVQINSTDHSIPSTSVHFVQAVEFWTRAAIVSPLTGRWITIHQHTPHSHTKPTAKLHGPKLYFSSFPRPGRSASPGQGIRSYQDHQDEQAAKSSRSSAPYNTNP
jgi:hypothetical protein